MFDFMFFYFLHHLGMRRGGLCLTLCFFYFLHHLGMRRGGLGGRWDLRNRDIASSASGSQPSSPAPHSLKE